MCGSPRASHPRLTKIIRTVQAGVTDAFPFLNSESQMIPVGIDHRININVLLRGPAQTEGEADAHALIFATLVVSILGLIFANRAWSGRIFCALRSPNRAFW